MAEAPVLKLRSEDLPRPNPWALYQVRKNLWLKAHPFASQEEYEAAVRLIAKECEV